MLGRMKGLGLPRKKLGKVFEKLQNFRPYLRLFMSWKKLPLLYLRRLARELVFVLAFFFVVILLINLTLPKSPFETLKDNLLVNSYDTNSHRLLGQLLLNSNDFSPAETETLKAFNDPHSSEVLKIQAIKNQPDQIKKDIVFWQKLAETFPGYRDAYLKLAVLSGQIYRNFDVYKFLEKAAEIDPNNEVLKKLSLQPEFRL
ncbi:hypothetical protein M1403_02845 [Patescibacteria group bacterium]|nr:hypothetical protein [Patescibacteria group bacterium]